MRQFFILALGLVLVGLTPGCKRSDAPPEPLAVEKLGPTLNEAFAKGPAKARELSTEVVDAVEVKNYPLAFATVQNLCSSTELSEDQRLVATRAMLTVSDLLQKAQASGDKASAEMLQMHRRSR